jgi:predicted AAA+ superfamily ATPase
MSGYRERLIDGRITRKLRSSGGILIEGARSVGKTTTGRHHARSEIRLDEPNTRLQVQIVPQEVLAGPVPRLIDEWQVAPDVWNAARREIDSRGDVGQFILTGSAAPADDVTRHTGAGRFARLTLRPMSLSESGDSESKVSFSTLFDGIAVAGFGGPTVEDYANLLVRGGWPGLVGVDVLDAQDRLRDYIDNITRVDLRTLESPPDPIRVRALLRAVARNTATNATLEKLAKESLVDDSPLQGRTIRKYLDQLSRVFVVDELKSWRTHLRSNVQQRVKPKWHLTCPSLAAAILGATPKALLRDLNTFGFLFESMVVRDLRAYADAEDAQVFYYRDSSGLEVDAIIEKADGTWIAVEVKMGGQEAIDEAAKHLFMLRARLTPEKMNAMASLNIITAGNGSFRRPDGVNVVALGHLAP